MHELTTDQIIEQANIDPFLLRTFLWDSNRGVTFLRQLIHELSQKPSTEPINIVKGFTLFYLEDFNEATVTFKSIIKQNSTCILGLAGLAYLDIKNKAHDSARIYLQKTIELTNKSPPIKVFILNALGLLYIQTKQFNKAEELYDNALKNNPTYPLFYHNRGLLHFLKAQYEKAEECYLKVLTLQPNNLDVMCSLGMLYSKLNRVSQAEKMYQQALTINPNYVEILSVYGHLKLNAADLKMAESLFQKAVSNNPQKPPIYHTLGTIYFKLKKFEKAAETLQKGLAIDPKNFQLLFSLGQLRFMQQRYQDAEKYLTKAADVTPNNANIWYYLGGTYSKQQLFDKALTAYERSVELNPKHINALFSLGCQYQKKKEWAKAESTFQRILKLNPKHLTSVFKLGINAYHQNDFIKSEELLLKVVASEEKATAAWEYLGAIKRKQELYEEAKRYYKKMLELHPDHANALFYMGICCKKLEQFSEAETYLHEVLRLKPTAVKAHTELGNVLMAQKRLPEAMDFLKKGLELASIQIQKQKNRSEAARIFPKIKSLFEKIIITCEKAGQNYQKKKNFAEADRFFKIASDLNQKYRALPTALNKLGAPPTSPRPIPQKIVPKEQARKPISENINQLKTLARNAFKLDKTEQAKKLCLKVIELDPRAYEQWLILGTIYSRDENSKEAIRCLEKYIELKPDKVNIMGEDVVSQMLGFLYFAESNYERAVNHLTKYLEKNPEEFEGWIILGQSWERRNFLGGGQTLTSALMDQMPALFNKFGITAENEQEQEEMDAFMTNLKTVDPKNYQEAEACYREALRLNSTSPDAWILLGHLYITLRKWTEAEQHLQKALELDPESVDAWHNLSMLYEKQGNRAQAHRCYKKAAELNPNYRTMRSSITDFSLYFEGKLQGSTPIPSSPKSSKDSLLGLPATKFPPAPPLEQPIDFSIYPPPQLGVQEPPEILPTLFSKSTSLTFLVGAGISIDPPTNLPPARSIANHIIRYCAPPEEIETLHNLPNLRYEYIIEVVQNLFDKNLRFLETLITYADTESDPNINHKFLAQAILTGHFVITTNYDSLIERALMEQVPKDAQHAKILPIFTSDDFRTYTDPYALMQQGKYPIYKVHGSVQNLLSEELTLSSLVTTLRALGRHRDAGQTFTIESSKKPAVLNLLKNRTLIVLGYSGSDDFDISPLLLTFPQFTSLIWINHVSPSHNGSPKYDNGKMASGDELDQLVQTMVSILQDVGETEADDVESKAAFQIYRLDPSSGQSDPRDLSHLKESDAILLKLASHVSFPIYRINAHTATFLEKSLWPLLFEGAPEPIDPQLLQLSKLGKVMNTLLTKLLFWRVVNVDKYIFATDLFLNSFQLDHALRCALNGLALAQRETYREKLPLFLEKIGKIYYLQDNFRQAARYFKSALDRAEELNNLEFKAAGLNNLGLVHEQENRLDLALDCYQKALAIAESVPNFEPISSYLNNIAGILLRQNRFEDALAYYQRSLTLTAQQGDLYGKATLLNNLGRLREAQGHFDLALENYTEALQIADKISNINEKVKVLINIATIRNKQGDTQESIAAYEDAFQILKSIGQASTPAAQNILQQLAGLK